MTATQPGQQLNKPSRPACAVRGVLHSGEAICGAVINASLCGYDGTCEHQQTQQQFKPEQSHE